MHLVSSILFAIGVLILLATGLSSLLHDLMERGPHEAPYDDGAAIAEREFAKVKPRLPARAVAWNGRPEQQRL